MNISYMSSGDSGSCHSYSPCPRAAFEHESEIKNIELYNLNITTHVLLFWNGLSIEPWFNEARNKSGIKNKNIGYTIHDWKFQPKIHSLMIQCFDLIMT